MSDIISTWICLDDKNTATYFPSSKGLSSNVKVQHIYWRCIVCFFFTARFHNPNVRLALFSNSTLLPVVDGVEIAALLKQWKVEIYFTPFEYITPAGYYGMWRNQFYEFSIFKFIADHPGFAPSDNFILLDSDCIITKGVSDLFTLIKKDKCVTYIIDYREDFDINGITRFQMKQIFEELIGYAIPSIPDYHAGEFYAATIETTKKIVQDFYMVWEQLLQRHRMKLLKLHEEAHILSYLIFKNEWKGRQGNVFIKRIWTDPTAYRNVEPGDEQFAIWHLPGEKRTGFKSFFQFLKLKNFDSNSLDAMALAKKCQSLFNVPKINIINKVYFAGKHVGKKVMAFR